MATSGWTSNRPQASGPPAPPVGDEGGSAPRSTLDSMRRSPARPAPKQARALGLPRLNLHTDGHADDAARTLGAEAFAFGPDLYFRRRSFAPGTPNGDELLNHEAGHVRQYFAHRQPTNGSPRVTATHSPLERSPEATPGLGRGPRAEPGPPQVIARTKLTTEQALAKAEADLVSRNYVDRWNALEDLVNVDHAKAFDLIVGALGDALTRRQALEAAMWTFALRPDRVTEGLERAIQNGDRRGAGRVILHLQAMRPHLNAATRPYEKLDHWLSNFDAAYAGVGTASALQARVEGWLDEMHNAISRETWAYDGRSPEARNFLDQIVSLRAQLWALDAEGVQAMHDEVLASRQSVEELAAGIRTIDKVGYELIVNQKLSSKSDEVQFYETELRPYYLAAMNAMPDWAAMRDQVTLANSRMLRQGTLYQNYKVGQLASRWRAIKKGRDAATETGILSSTWVTGKCGLLGAVTKTGSLVFDIETDLDKRIADLETRVKEERLVAGIDLASVQQDLVRAAYILAGAQQIRVLNNICEILEAEEPDIWGNYDDIQSELKGWANKYLRAIEGGDLRNVGVYAADTDYDFLLSYRVEAARRRAHRNSKLADLGIFAASLVVGGLVGLAVRGGTLLVMGTRAATMGKTGAQILGGAEFLANVTAFTLVNRELRSAAFGSAPKDSFLVEASKNAMMFMAFGAVMGRTANLFSGGKSMLAKTAGFLGREGVRISAFGGVAAGFHWLETQTLPPDFKSFAQQTVTTYILVMALGAGLHRVRARMDATILLRADAKIMRTELQAADAEKGLASAALEKTNGLAQGAERNDLLVDARDATVRSTLHQRNAVMAAHRLGLIGEAEAKSLFEALEQSASELLAMDRPTLGDLSLDFAELKGVRRVDGSRNTFTFDADAKGVGRRLGELERAGYERGDNPQTGEVTLSFDSKVVVRLLPAVGASGLAAGAAAPKVTKARFVRNLVFEGQLPADLQGKVRVETDLRLQGRTTRVYYELDRFGFVTDVHVRTGVAATQGDMALHAETIRTIHGYTTLSGRARTLFLRFRSAFGDAPPAPGTRAFDAALEVAKLPKVIQDRALELSNSISGSTTVDAARTRLIKAELAKLDKQLADNQKILDSPDRWNEPGRRYVAAEGVSDRLVDLWGRFESREGKLTLGTEVETIVRGTRHDVARSLRDFLSEKLGLKVKLRVTERGEMPSGYKLTYELNGNEYTWKVVRDASLEGKSPLGSEISAELVSPIMRTAEDAALYRSALTFLEGRGLVSDAIHGGLHTHVGLPSTTPAEIAFTGLLFARIEADLARVFSQAHPRKFYAGKTASEVLEIFKEADINVTTEAYLQKVIAAGDRYQALNWEAMEKHGTVEFRLFNSTLDAAGVAMMQRFSQGLMRAIRTKDAKLLALIESGEPLTARSLSKALDLGLTGDKAEAVLGRLSKALEADIARIQKNQPLTNQDFQAPTTSWGKVMLVVALAAAAAGIGYGLLGGSSKDDGKDKGKGNGNDPQPKP